MKKNQDQIKIEKLEKELEEIKKIQSQIKPPRAKLIDRPGLVIATIAVILGVFYFGQAVYSKFSYKENIKQTPAGTPQPTNQQTNNIPKPNQPQAPQIQQQPQTQQPQKSALNLQTPVINGDAIRNVNPTPAIDQEAYQKKLDSLSPAPTSTTNCFYTPEGTYFCSTH